MEWTIELCPNPECVVETWLVQPHPGHYSAWLITDRWGEESSAVIANVPVCPRCGTTLCSEIAPENPEQTPVSEEVFEEYVLGSLDTAVVRSFNDLSIALVRYGDAQQIRRALNRLACDGRIATGGERRGVWFRGYRRVATTEALPALF